jgi:tetratricopeptide (TPR) repeat protein
MEPKIRARNKARRDRILPLAATNCSILVATAEAFVKGGRKEEAVSWFEKALALASNDVDAALGLVRLRLELRDAAAAADLLSRSLAENPFDLRLLAAQRGVGLALFDQSRWKDADPWLRSAADLEPWDPLLAEAHARVSANAGLTPAEVGGSSTMSFAP